MHIITSCPICGDDFMYQSGSLLDLNGRTHPVAFDENGNAVSFAPICPVCNIKDELESIGVNDFSYDEYRRVVKAQWEAGNINELFESSLIIEKDRMDKEVSYRMATMDEYENMLKNHD